MDAQQALQKLQSIQDGLRNRNFDEEVAHAEADDVLTDLLAALGHGDVVNEYENIPKWYA